VVKKKKVKKIGMQVNLRNMANVVDGMMEIH
jgi:hypothetical protein